VDNLTGILIIIVIIIVVLKFIWNFINR
jgi:hypothetical protein